MQGFCGWQLRTYTPPSAQSPCGVISAWGSSLLGLTLFEASFVPRTVPLACILVFLFVGSSFTRGSFCV